MNYLNSIIAGLENRMMSTPIDGVPDNIVYPNDPTDNRNSLPGEYYRVNHVFGDTAQACLGDEGRDVSNGIFQIDVVTRFGKGRSQNLDAILNHFARGTIINHEGINLRVTTTGVIPPFIDRDKYIQPLEIYWQVFTNARLQK